MRTLSQTTNTRPVVERRQGRGDRPLLRRPIVILSCAALIAASNLAAGPRFAEAGLVETSQIEAGAGQVAPVPKRPAARLVETSSVKLDAATWNTVLSGLISTDEALRSTSALSLREHLQAAFARDDIRAQLEAYGIGVEEAQARVEALTDQEVAELAASLDQMPAGAGERLPPSLIETFARTVAAVLFLPFAIIFTILGVPYESPLYSEEG